jgi:hypothetical protein
VRRDAAVKSLDTDYWRLNTLTKAVLVLSGLSIVTGAFALFPPPAIGMAGADTVQLVNLSAGSLIAAFLATLLYVWWLNDLTSIIARYETGTSFEDIVKLLIQRARVA